jgi:hypothetical protein
MNTSTLAGTNISTPPAGGAGTAGTPLLGPTMIVK